MAVEVRSDGTGSVAAGIAEETLDLLVLATVAADDALHLGPGSARSTGEANRLCGAGRGLFRITSAAVDFQGSFLLGMATGLSRYSYKNARRLASFTPANDIVAVVPNRRRCTSCMGVAAVSGENIWVGASDGFLYHLQGRSLRQVRRVNFRQPLVGHLLHDQHEFLYVVSFDKKLYCLQAKP